MNENVAAARALLPGGSWAPYLVSAVPLVGGAIAGWSGERRPWLVAGLWGAAMAGAWGGFNPLGATQWVVGAVGLSAAGWAAGQGRGGSPGAGQTLPPYLSSLRGRLWLLGPLLAVVLAAAGRQAPGLALTLGAGGSAALVEVALERAHAGEPDEAIVFGEAAVAVANQRGSADDAAAAELVTASLHAAGGDCATAVEHARLAHIALGPDLPNLDQAVRECFQTQGP